MRTRVALTIAHIKAQASLKLARVAAASGAWEAVADHAYWELQLGRDHGYRSAEAQARWIISQAADAAPPGRQHHHGKDPGRAAGQALSAVEGLW